MKATEHVWWNPERASDAAIAGLVAGTDAVLPADYVAFLERANGCEIGIRVSPYCLVVWAAEEVLPSNKGYEIDKWMPGMFAFGSSGGGAIFAFDFREGRAGGVVSFPAIGMDFEYVEDVAPTFSALLGLIGEAEHQ